MEIEERLSGSEETNSNEGLNPDSQQKKKRIVVKSYYSLNNKYQRNRTIKRPKINESENEESFNENLDNSNNLDECDVFGRYIAIQLKKLPVQQCLFAQQEIHQIVTQYRLMTFGAETNNMSPVVVNTFEDAQASSPEQEDKQLYVPDPDV